MIICIHEHSKLFVMLSTNLLFNFCGSSGHYPYQNVILLWCICSYLFSFFALCCYSPFHALKSNSSVAFRFMYVKRHTHDDICTLTKILPQIIYLYFLTYYINTNCDPSIFNKLSFCFFSNKNT